MGQPGDKSQGAGMESRQVGQEEKEVQSEQWQQKWMVK